MDNKEHTEAANALINWFNSQDIAVADAAEIMSKVIAKILVSAVSNARTPNARREAINEGVDLFTLHLVHDVNDRLHHVRHRPSGR